MANTHRGWFELPLWAGSMYRFDQIASMIAAGSAIGGAYEAGASVAFPRAASLHLANGSILYAWDTLIFRSSATAMNYTTDPLGTANASVGIPAFGSDVKPVIYPSDPKNLSFYAVGSGSLHAIFVQGNDLDI